MFGMSSGSLWEQFGSILGACSAHFGVLFRTCFQACILPSFCSFWGGDPPARRGVGGKGAALWGAGNIAFVVPEGGFTVCLWTFCTGACVEAQG